MLLQIISLTKDPKKEWINIQNKDITNKNILLKLLLPTILIGCFIKLLGRFIILEDYSIINAILACTSYIIINLTIIYISAWIIFKLLPKFKSDKEFDLVFRIISFSSVPFIIATSIASIHPNLSFINILSLYSIVLFWKGVPLFKVAKEQQTGFILVCLMIIASVSLVISLIIMSGFLSIFLIF